MTITEFWKLMDKWREASAGETDEFFELGQNELGSRAPSEVRDFYAILGSYMSHINECVWLDMACKVINGYVSDDTSLYFNLWVISRGREAVRKAVADPDSLADLPNGIPWGIAEFEMLMAMAFNEDSEGFDYEPDMEGSPFFDEIAGEIHYKNGDRYGEFDTFEDAMDAIPEHCPRLIKRAAEEGFDWQNYI